ncbi:unnamed protein product, partial [Acidocella sp. C78]
VRAGGRFASLPARQGFPAIRSRRAGVLALRLEQDEAPTAMYRS